MFCSLHVEYNLKQLLNINLLSKIVSVSVNYNVVCFGIKLEGITQDAIRITP